MALDRASAGDLSVRTDPRRRPTCSTSGDETSRPVVALASTFDHTLGVASGVGGSGSVGWGADWGCGGSGVGGGSGAGGVGVGAVVCGGGDDGDD